MMSFLDAEVNCCAPNSREFLKRGEQGAEIGWLIITAISETNGWPKEAEATRNQEIETVRTGLGIASENVFQLGFAPAGLDDVRRSDLVSRIAEVVGQFKPTEVLLPFPGDTHSDHLHAFEAAQACVKSFRSPSVRRVVLGLCYETLSETNFGINPIQNAFRPNLFVDITTHLDRKVELLRTYLSEIADVPFPRSGLKRQRALALLRGSQAGVEAAEAFMTLKEIE